MGRKEDIEKFLFKELSFVFLNIEDESHQHHVPKDAQSHFKITAVSDQFKGLSPVARHQWIFRLLKPEFDLGLHALSLHLYTVEEWEKKEGSVSSPKCKDGFHR